MRLELRRGPRTIDGGWHGLAWDGTAGGGDWTPLQAAGRKQEARAVEGHAHNATVLFTARLGAVRCEGPRDAS